MADRWFYAHEGTRSGPFSSGQFVALARLGSILRTDTVWLNEAEKGVEARRVRNLFPAVELAAPAPVVVVAPAPVVPPVAVEQVSAPAAAPPATPVLPHLDHAPRKLRAMALSGATIVSQDGKVVRFRKKCTACGHEDSSWGTQPITVGVMRAGFFCPKCRKHREVQLRGSQG
jgi:hypothetical protein